MRALRPLRQEKEQDEYFKDYFQHSICTLSPNRLTLCLSAPVAERQFPLHRPVRPLVCSQAGTAVPGHEANLRLEGRRPSVTLACPLTYTSKTRGLLQRRRLRASPQAFVSRRPPETAGGVGPQQGTVRGGRLVRRQAMRGVRAKMGARMRTLG